jgi:hypothetical protein
MSSKEAMAAALACMSQPWGDKSLLDSTAEILDRHFAPLRQQLAALAAAEAVDVKGIAEELKEIIHRGRAGTLGVDCRGVCRSVASEVEALIDRVFSQPAPKPDVAERAFEKWSGRTPDDLGREWNDLGVLNAMRRAVELDRQEREPEPQAASREGAVK